jgi:hypothetical protein
MMGDDWEQRNYPQRICRMICRSYCGGVLRLRRHGLEQHAWAAAILSGLALLSGCGGSTNSPGGGGNPPPSATATIRNQVTGTFKLAMSTSFQPAEWDYTLFQSFPSLTTTLGNLQPQHVRLQGQSQGIPQGASGSSSTAWDFAILDAITQPVLGVGDHSPEFQIAKAPPFMYASDDNSNDFLDLTFQHFAEYAQNLVLYYNQGGFIANGQVYVSPSSFPITWWGVYNEPNINNNLTPQQYVAMYNTLVPAMQAIDPSLKFVAMELADFSGQPQAWLPTFVNGDSGVTAQVDAMATHFYSTCNQKDTDAQLFSTIPGFASDVDYFYAETATNPALTQVPVWVTENNVNADYDAGNGMSACNPGQPFVVDERGSSAFFAAWRPYVFSQLGQAGVQALYHWDFGADAQFGEVNASTGQPQLSYWIDYWLERMFPSSAGASLLQYSNTDDAEIEVLPVLNSDGSVVVMVADHAINSPEDNNGPGAPRSVLVDVSALGTFSSGTQLAINAETNAVSGPTASSFAPAPQLTVTFGGYGVTFLMLKP